MKRLFSIFLLVSVLMPLSVSAQHKHGLFHKVDSILASRFRAKGDSLYISRPEQPLTLRVLNNVSGTSFTLEGIDDDEDRTRIRLYFKDPLRYTVTFSANYRGLAVALAFNPANVFGKKSSTEFNINSYSNRYGFDFIYETNGKFDGSALIGKERVELEEPLIREKSLKINAYYAFNYKRFSYPAAFSQSYVQKKSAGSIMLGFSYHRSTITLGNDESEWEYDDIRKIKLSYAGLGVGYGYNFVPGRNWLIHASVLPTLVFWDENKIIFHGYVDSLKSQFPEYSLVARSSIVHYFKHFFTGLTLVFNYTSAGDLEDFRIDHNKWRLRFLVGKRFNL